MTFKPIIDPFGRDDNSGAMGPNYLTDYNHFVNLEINFGAKIKEKHCVWIV